MMNLSITLRSSTAIHGDKVAQTAKEHVNCSSFTTKFFSGFLFFTFHMGLNIFRQTVKSSISVFVVVIPCFLVLNILRVLEILKD